VSCCTGAQDFRSLWRFHEIHCVEAHFDRREINIEICSLKSLTSFTQHFFYRRETAIKIVNYMCQPRYIGAHAPRWPLIRPERLKALQNTSQIQKREITSLIRLYMHPVYYRRNFLLRFSWSLFRTQPERLVIISPHTDDRARRPDARTG
jgi:hypothetical protein